MFISYITLAIGVVVALCLFMFVGRFAGFSAMVLWSLGTAYFVMPPSYSLNVSDPHDWAALALYGAAGLVLVGVKPYAKPLPTRMRQGHKIQLRPFDRANIKDVLADLTESSDVGIHLRERGIEVYVRGLQTFPCSYTDAISILSQVFADVLIEPQLRRISVQVARQPEVAWLFVWAHTVWPPPLQECITIGKGAETPWKAVFSNLPTETTATCFDSGYGRIYQLRRIIIS